MAKLSDKDNGVRYSKTERLVFEALPADGRKITTVALTDKIYGRRQRPFNARQNVLSILNTLVRKVKANKEPFKLKRSERRGPHPIEFWVE